MPKFNKDTFINDITSKVQKAIDKKLITQEDIHAGDVDRLHGFIQYELLNYIENRKCAVDILGDFNYDEKTSWDKLQEIYGQFKSILDLALINLWKFMESVGATSYEYYKTDTVVDSDEMDSNIDIVAAPNDEISDDPRLSGVIDKDYERVQDGGDFSIESGFEDGGDADIADFSADEGGRISFDESGDEV